MFSGLGLSLLYWIVFWAIAFSVQRLLIPHWLVRTPEGVSTVLQALPAAVIALVTVILASLFVIATQVVALYGPRAILIIFVDVHSLALATQAICLTFVTLFLAARLPAGVGSP